MPAGIEEGGLNYRYNIVNMHDIDCQYLLDKQTPEALVLAILCDFKGRDEREVIHYIISELKRHYQHNEKGFRDAVTMLEVLSTNRDLKAIVQEEEKMLSVKWEDLPSYEIGLEKGREEGIEKGIEQEKQLLLRQINKRFGSEVLFQAKPIVSVVSDVDILEQIGEWIIDYDAGDAFLQQLSTAIKK